MSETLLTVRQAAKELQVSRNVVYLFIRRGQLRAVQLTTRSMRIRRMDLESFLQRRATKK